MAMGIFERLFQQQRIRQPLRRPRGGLIECSDCGALGYIAFYGLGEHEVPPGWTLTWCGLKPLFICPKCKENRVRYCKELLDLNN